MEWGKIIPSIVAFLTAFLLPFFLSRRKKGGPKKLTEFRQHLQRIGIKFVELDKDSEQAKLGTKFSRSQKSVGAFVLEGRNIDLVIVTSVASQYGVNYFVEYLVKSNFELREGSVKKTKTVKKRSSLFGRDVVDIVWKGNKHLAQRLNLDYEIKHKLLQAYKEKFKGGILIIPEPKYGYTRIKTNYNLPSPMIFDAIDSIARYIKSGWIEEAASLPNM
jgi:hypothetical protein